MSGINSEDVLNYLAGQCIPREEKLKAVPHHDYYSLSNFQIIPDGDVPFALDIVEIPDCYEVKCKKNPEQVSRILRIYMSMGEASRIISGDDNIERWFNDKKRLFSKTLAENYNLEDITLKYVGPNLKYLKLMENYSAYEFRVLVEYDDSSQI